MPEIFGNPYLLPAIVVVVLVLLSLLLYLTRRSRPEKPAKALPAQQPGEQPRQPEPAQDAKPAAQTSPAPTSDTSPAIGTHGTTAEAPVATETSATNAASVRTYAAPAPPTAPVSATDGPTSRGETPSISKTTPPRSEASPLQDPLMAVIMDILARRGDWSDADANRLEVFKPEKILETTERVVLPRDRRLAEQARVRLAHIRDVALNAQLTAKPEDVVVAAETSETVDEAPAGPAVAATDLPEPVTAAKPFMGGPFGPRPDSLKTPRPAPLAPLGSSGEEAKSAPPAEPSAAPPWGRQMARPRMGEPQPAEHVSTEPEEQPAVQTAAPSAISRPLEADAAASPVVPQVDDETPAGEDLLSDLRVQIKTAADLFALPAAQHVDMLAFLEPPQLSKVFEATNDAALKRGVIDTLEHVGNPSALGVLRQCLDDPDPEIQLYALEAADRLLGTD